MNTAVVTKVPNYTAEMLKHMVALYSAVGIGLSEEDHDARAKVVKELANEYKKDVRSIRSKLVREKREDGTDLYIARSAVSKVTNAKPAKKDAMSADLINAARDTSVVSENSMVASSIEKMNKPEIAIITALLNYLYDEIENLNAELVDAVEIDENAGESIG